MSESLNWLYASRVPAAVKNQSLVVRVPGHVSKRKLLRLLARELHFPAYFGHNWDALEECLRDLSWLPRDRRVVLWHVGLPLARYRDDRATYLDVLRSAVAKHASSSAHPLTVVLPKSMAQAATS